ncbi:putative threo-3-hydroxyaspartate ammonia-lyase-like [Apostichopus japonicus]|uniref:L-serine deaminase n=1 Tax=Stichopus japonicus TaxID=307972 RepID=A0A2G8L6A3_STIJA|nr:putative threo-3-hydroxyaspartate ammonia-lyase-like [Apostichopus japonicus]
MSDIIPKRMPSSQETESSDRPSPTKSSSSSQVKGSSLPQTNGSDHPAVNGSADHHGRMDHSMNELTISKVDEEEIKDPACDPDNPVKVKFQDVSAAAYKIRNGVQRTSCQKSRLSDMLGLELYIKSDFQQITGRYDNPNIIAGQGTLGLEIIEQVPDLDAVVIPVGGGGLIAGMALAIKSLSPKTLIIGVESEQCASFSSAMKAGHPTYTKSAPTLADGLAVPVVGVNAFATARDIVDKVVTVSEDLIAVAILRLIEVEKAVVEGAGACSLAALLSDKLPELKGKKVAIPLCGGNIDTTVLGRVLERGLAADGRLCRFVVTVSDRPGGIADLTRLLADQGASIKDIFHERAWLKSEVFHVQVKVVVETRDSEHSVEIERRLREKYDRVLWGSSLKF